MRMIHRAGWVNSFLKGSKDARNLKAKNFGLKNSTPVDLESDKYCISVSRVSEATHRQIP